MSGFSLLISAGLELLYVEGVGVAAEVGEGEVEDDIVEIGGKVEVKVVVMMVEVVSGEVRWEVLDDIDASVVAIEEVVVLAKVEVVVLAEVEVDVVVEVVVIVTVEVIVSVTKLVVSAVNVVVVKLVGLVGVVVTLAKAIVWEIEVVVFEVELEIIEVVVNRAIGVVLRPM